jgi:hypothetical protein
MARCVDKNSRADGRRVYVAAAIQRQRALRFTVANKTVNGVGMRVVVDKRAHRGFRIQRVARLPVFRLLFKSASKLVGNAFFQQQTCTGDKTWPWL